MILYRDEYNGSVDLGYHTRCHTPLGTHRVPTQSHSLKTECACVLKKWVCRSYTHWYTHRSRFQHRYTRDVYTQGHSSGDELSVYQ